MPRFLILAYGNPLRCDDGLAWRVAELLAGTVSGDVEIMTRHQLTPELALSVSEAETVLFVDAAQGGIPGELKFESVKPQANLQTRISIFSHEFSPASILRVAQELYGKSPEAYTISLCGECFDQGEMLSAKVEDSLPQVVALIGEVIQGNTNNA